MLVRLRIRFVFTLKAGVSMGQLQDRVVRQRKLRNKRILVGMILLVLFTAVVVGAYCWFDSKLSNTKRTDGMMVAQGKINIMVLGVDHRQDDVGRSDTLFVATVDTKTKNVSVLSIPRDTRVKIPGHSYDKINHAYAFGGRKLSQEVVEDLLGIPIDYYVKIDTKAFERIIDAIGGIDINVDKRMYYEDPYDDNGGLVIDIRPGEQHMDGSKAIQYVRYRDEEGDIGRIARQQKFLAAVLTKIASPSIITKIPSIIQEVNSAIDTNLSISQMISIAGMVKEANEKGLTADMVPGKPAYIDDISYWLPDVVALRQHLAQSLGVKINEKAAVIMKEQAREYESSIPKEMKVIDTPPDPKQKTKEEIEADKKKELEKNKKTTAAKDSKDVAKEKQGPIMVEIINASGSDGVGSEVAATLRGMGFTVTGVSNLTAGYKNTVVISNTSDEAVTGKFSGLPFNYSLQINKDDSTTPQATVVIGKDYLGK